MTATPLSPQQRAAIDDEVESQRAADKALLEQMRWRIKALGGKVDLSAPENRATFAEVWEAFTIPTTNLDPLPGECWADEEDGGSILVKAFIYFRGQPLGFVQRRLLFARRMAIHEMLIINSVFRGRGLNLALLLKSFAFYDRLGLEQVYLEAGLATGRWHWARVGFDFARDVDRQAVRDWAHEVLHSTGIRGLRADRYTSASRFARMGGNRKISLQRIADALPAHRSRIEEAAAGNDLAMSERVPLGRAVMITGPSWYGRLELSGPGRAQFEAYAAAKVKRMGAAE
jgi:hypothetical protein